MKKNIFLVLIIVLPLFSFAQNTNYGLPFMSMYSDEDYGDAEQIWAITQDSRGIMYFGCNYGLKTFDGKIWKSYNILHSTIIRSLAAHKDGMVFYGAESDFGAIISNKKGELEFYSFYLNKFENIKQDFGSVWKTLVINDRVYFQAFEKVFYCDLPIRIGENDSLLNDLKTISPETLFHLSFEVNNKFYIREWEIGLQEVIDGKKKLIPGGEQFALSRLYIMLPIDDNKILLGTRQSGFYIYDTQKKENAITPLELSDPKLINESTLYSAIKLPDGTIAIGTFNNGVIIINQNGQIVKHFNSKFGLPDNNVLSIYTNNKENNSIVWLATDKGITKAEIYAPFTVWNEVLGIKGKPNSAIRFKNIFYVSTSEGLYFLDESEFLPKFKLIVEETDCWKLLKFKIPNSEEEIMLMGSSLGISEIHDFKVNKIAELQNTKELYQSKKEPGNIYIGSDGGLSLIKYENNSWSDLQIYDKQDLPTVGSISEFQNYIALGTHEGLILLENINSDKLISIDSVKGLPLEGQDYFLHRISDKTIVTSGAGLYSLIDTSKVEPYNSFGDMYSNNTKGVYKFMKDEEAFWMSTYETNEDNANHQLIRFFDNKNVEKDSVFSKRIPQASTFLLYPDNDKVWIGNSKGLYLFDKSIDKNYKEPFNTIISKVTTENDSVLFMGTFIPGSEEMYSLESDDGIEKEEQITTLKYNNNELFFEWSAPYYEKTEDTEYSFRLLGETETWSKWDRKSERRYSNIYEGDYIFEVKARNIYNTESSIAQYKFKVLPPWHRTIWAFISYFVLAVFLVFVIIKLYTKKLKRENEKLEQTVKERTAEIRMQNEEIKAQRDEIQAQKDVVEKAKDKIEKQQKSIMDSIHYASRIQEAVLPPDEFLQEVLGEHFVLFRPRDIVSGDFYWATQRGNKTVIVAADCTGHGVPGAFMSMLGISFLNEIVNKEEILQANIILNRLRQNVKKSLRQTGKDNEAKDGMDVAICIIDMDEMKLQFAGAYNPLYILREGEISKVNADRMPIGIYLREKESFTNNIVDLQKGDHLYIFSDGYVDQFGGPTDDKIKSVKFKSLLLENHLKSPDEQKEALVKYLESWMAYKDKTGRVYKQVDDILVIGIEI